ncbi:thiopeptide-type bacteriocin biosynthesis protein [Actinomadura sp. LOL_016]|uniref:thiopeptide-type bacteriocin biosynthesis protein n=1 Tax=unclassified Actinomadura TaxID=2626254 RepID=UPI003A8005DD
MTSTSWRQSNVAFHTWATAEHDAVTHLLPVLARAEEEGLIGTWFFVRKAPCWRVRYLPGSDTAHRQMRQRLHALPGHAEPITQVTDAVYEPEVRAFGGADAMKSAHRLFHRDCRHLLDHLTGTQQSPRADRRRELAILLCTALLRGAHLDWYEQGDVWAQVAQHRHTTDQVATPAPAAHMLTSGVRRLMSVDPTIPMRPGGPLAFAADWAGAYCAAGAELAALTAAGQLHRGLRAILAHHVLFAFNRAGLPYATQAVLAEVATTVVFGADPTTDPNVGSAADHLPEGAPS